MSIFRVTASIFLSLCKSLLDLKILCVRSCGASELFDVETLLACSCALTGAALYIFVDQVSDYRGNCLEIVFMKCVGPLSMRTVIFLRSLFIRVKAPLHILTSDGYTRRGEPSSALCMELQPGPFRERKAPLNFYFLNYFVISEVAFVSSSGLLKWSN